MPIDQSNSIYEHTQIQNLTRTNEPKVLFDNQKPIELINLNGSHQIKEFKNYQEYERWKREFIRKHGILIIT